MRGESRGGGGQDGRADGGIGNGLGSSFSGSDRGGQAYCRASMSESLHGGYTSEGIGSRPKLERAGCCVFPASGVNLM